MPSSASSTSKPALLEHSPRGEPDHFFVVHHQQLRPAAFRPGAACRQLYVESGSLTRRAFDADRPMVRPDDAGRRGEAQAAAHELGCKERIVHAGEHLLVHTAAVIRNLEANVHPRPTGLIVRRLCTGDDPDGPGFPPDSLRRVQRQVDQELLDLSRVGVEQREIGIEVEQEFDIPGDGRFEQAAALRNDLRDVHGCQNEPAHPRIGQHLGGKVRGALTGFEHLLDERARTVRRWQLIQHQGRVAQDACEQVIEIVRNAARERADALELLRPEQARLHPLPFADVSRDHRATHHSARCIPHGRNGQRDVESAAVLPRVDSLEALDALPAPEALHDCRILGYALQGEQRFERKPLRFLLGIPVHPLRCNVPVLDGSIQAVGDDRVIGRFDQGREALARHVSLMLPRECADRRQQHLGLDGLHQVCRRPAVIGPNLVLGACGRRCQV